MKILLSFVVFMLLFLTGISVFLVIKNHKLLRQIQDFDLWHTLAFTDDLTGVYNRTAYSKHVREIEKVKERENLGIMLFDIDNFKAINDTQGHLAGDMVLKAVSQILVSVFPSPQYRVYRIGGDEFAVLGTGITEMEIIDQLIQLKEVLEKDGGIRLSKGYAVIEESVKEAFENADEMLYADKGSKKTA